MKIIGITGPIGVGKSYVSSLISSKGFPKIDTDEVYHSLVCEYSEAVREIEASFGRSVVKDDGSLNRTELAKIVFSDNEKLTLLNEISHKYVRVKTLELIEAYRKKGAEAVVIEVPLMFESGFDTLCDEVICVVADEDTRIERIVARNGFSVDEAKKRIKKQKDIEFYIAKSSKIVYNNKSDDVEGQIDALLRSLLS